MERAGLWLIYLGIAAYVIFAVVLTITDFPWGAISLLFLAGGALIFFRVWRDRMNNPEDDHYSKNVHQ